MMVSLEKEPPSKADMIVSLSKADIVSLSDICIDDEGYCSVSNSFVDTASLIPINRLIGRGEFKSF